MLQKCQQQLAADINHTHVINNTNGDKDESELLVTEVFPSAAVKLIFRNWDCVWKPPCYVGSTNILQQKQHVMLSSVIWIKIGFWTLEHYD